MRPRISLNLAVSADGKISSNDRRPSGWTSRRDHERLQHLRESAHGLIVSHGTLKADRMTLQAPQVPLRCVVSRAGRFDPEHPLFHSPGGPIHLLVTDGKPGPVADATVHHRSLADFLHVLGDELGVGHLHCEGGGGLVAELAELDAIDEVHLTWAGHTVFGGHGSPTATGLPDGFLPQSRPYRLTHFEPLADEGECFLSYRRER